MRVATRQLTDSEYLQGIQTGDVAVVNALYEQFFPAILHLVRTNSGTERDAKDIFQEAVMVLYIKLRNDAAFELTSALSTYLYAVSRNLWLKQLKKNQRERVTITDTAELTAEATIEHDLIEREKEQLYRQHFARLGEDCQQVLKLYFEGVKLRDIAAQMGYGSEQYAKKRKFTCKEKLVSLIKGDARYNALRNG